MEDAVGSDAVDAETVAAQAETDVRPADGSGVEHGLGVDEHVLIGGARPGGAAVVQPDPQCPVAQRSEALVMPVEGAASVGQVQVVEGEGPDCVGSGGVLGGQGNGKPLCGAGGQRSGW